MMIRGGKRKKGQHIGEKNSSVTVNQLELSKVLATLWQCNAADCPIQSSRLD